jgi:regulator of protease activity HflC (stomatin/prohibitin superfamily)
MLINPFTITVAAHQRTLEFTDGRLSRVLEPGRYRRRTHAEYRAIDVRHHLYAIPPQEIPTADGVQVKVSAQVRSFVTDPVAFDQVAVAPMELVHFSVQRALRDAVSQLEAAAVLGAARGDLGRTLTQSASEAGAEVGIGIRSVDVKDVLLPAELRNAVLEAMVVQRQGQAKLEAARAETAALRSMANAAKLLDDHPALARMRLVQAAPYGTKIVIGLDRDATD